MELMKSPMTQQQHTTAGSISVMPQVRVSTESGDISVATQKPKPKPEVPPKSSKLEGNDPNNETLVAKLAKLSCSIPKPEEKLLLGKVRSLTEEEFEFVCKSSVLANLLYCLFAGQRQGGIWYCYSSTPEQKPHQRVQERM